MTTLGKRTAFFVGLLALCLGGSPSFAKKKTHTHATKRPHQQARAKSKTPTPSLPYGKENLAAHLNQIVASVDSGTSIGVHVKSMKYGETLYSHQQNTLFTPASILKIMTAEAALVFLGPDYKFPTSMMTDAKTTNNGLVNGDLYLVHSGDPSLTYNDLTDLIMSLKEQQIQTINGNVYVDNTAYDQDNLGPGWSWKDTNKCYSAPINASIIDNNCIPISVVPAKYEGYPAVVNSSPRYFYAAVANSTVTKAARNRSCRLSLNSARDNTITITGCMPKGNYSRGASIVISDVVEYNKSMLQSLLHKWGIQVSGYIGSKAAPPNAFALATHESKPLHTLVTEMLKKSDNVIAGSLFKKVGETYANQPGSWRNGSAATREILAKKAAVDTRQMNVLDGSGLSRDNQVTPAQIMQVLDFAFHNYATSYQFISALPIAGVDGTLKHRLSNVAWRVRAKTGSMAGVASLAGYAMSKDKEPLAFVIILNGRNNVWKYRAIEDKIVTALANYKR